MNFTKLQNYDDEIKTVNIIYSKWGKPKYPKILKLKQLISSDVLGYACDKNGQ